MLVVSSGLFVCLFVFGENGITNVTKLHKLLIGVDTLICTGKWRN
jgi:hypothetical protein